MQHEAIQRWLKRKAVADGAHHFLFALFVFVVGAVVLGVTFVFVSAVVWFVLNVGAAALSQILLNRPLHISAAAIAAISALFMAFLFLENRRTQREYFGRRGRAPFQRPGEFGGELMSLLVYSDVSSRRVADALLTGPRLVAGAWNSFRKACRLACLDADACSRTLAVLFAHPSRCSLGELNQLPDVRDPAKSAARLRDIEGVLFIELDPPGLTLTSELRQELAGALGLGSGPASDAARHHEPVHLPVGSIYELLGVAPGASLEDIEIAYHKWAAQSRRRAAEAKPEWNQEAEEQMRAVHAAYETFLAKQKSEQTEEPADRIESVWERYKRSRN